jgi:hypothetical protein
MSSDVLPAQIQDLSSQDTPSKRRIRKNSQTANGRPVAERFAITVAEAAEMSSLWTRTMKRMAADNLELTTTVFRRRLFLVAKLRAWLESQH